MAATKKAAEKAATKAAAAPVAEKEQPKAAAKKSVTVKVLKMYKDKALNRVVAEGETFETNEERLELLSGSGLVERV